MICQEAARPVAVKKRTPAKGSDTQQVANSRKGTDFPQQVDKRDNPHQARQLTQQVDQTVADIGDNQRGGSKKQNAAGFRSMENR